MHNQTILSGLAVSVDVLRYTPAGIPVLDFTIEHTAMRAIAGFERTLHCELAAQLSGDLAKKWAGGLLAGRRVILRGALAARSLRNPRLVLHVEHVEFEKV